MRWFVGWDSREGAAYQTCLKSMMRHSTVPLEIEPLKHKALRKSGLFTRRWMIDAQGQFWDLEDGRPFSTEFSHSRFLVPFLARGGWVFFVDADFVFIEDPAKILDELNGDYAVQVVKHRFEPENTRKMDGCLQEKYSRKNWSSLIAWNLDHEGNCRLTQDDVNERPGRWLHNFSWLDDSEIGELDPGWNYLVGHTKGVKPRAYHFTDGGPWFEDWQGGPLDEIWNEAAA